MNDRPIRSSMDLEQRALEWGFLPFFDCGIRGFSIEEITPRELWFNDEEPGPWEWKGPVIREGHCAYGKFFNRKAGYVSLDWLPHLANYRRTRRLAPNDDLAALDDIVLQTIVGEGTATIKELRRLLGFARGRGRRRADELVDTSPQDEKIPLDPILTRLQMELRLVISDFEYSIDRHGRPYGWGIARYTTPEALYGDLSTPCSPAESRTLILAHLKQLLPDASDRQIERLLG